MQRKDQLVTGNIYHITSKSIAGFRIFNSDSEYNRMLQMIRFYSYDHSLLKFSQFNTSAAVQKNGFERVFLESIDKSMRLVQIVAYCLMPTHIHLVLVQRKLNGISIAIGNALNAFARYFNLRHKRQGPLWVGRFKGIPVSSDEQLLHLTRYVHLNPVSAGLIKNASQWSFSSYVEYVAPKSVAYPLCDYTSLIGVSPTKYRTFVDDHAGYQKELAIIKKAIVDEN